MDNNRGHAIPDFEQFSKDRYQDRGQRPEDRGQRAESRQVKNRKEKSK